MTSYEWKPGHTYGQFKEPEYNAITYTWGRWRLKVHESPHVPSLAISGTPWQVPRVHPNAFTAAQLQDLLNKATRVYGQIENPVMEWNDHGSFQPVEFVWLDVACIDQREEETRSASEVGRQAQIFHGARQVFVWLSTISSAALERIILELGGMHDLMRLVTSYRSWDPESVAEQLTGARDCFQTILSDPWFSSLWTLQEAFLRPDAVLFSREAAAVPMKDMGGYHHILTDIIRYGDEFFARGVLEIGDPFLEIRRLIEDSGLRALISLNGVATYIAAGHRTASRDQDRIYGIQQIFRLRVGKSSPANEPGRSYTREQLELEFGTQLMKHHAVLSQMHVSTEPVPLGSAWFIGPTSTVPSEIAGNVSSNEAGSENTETPMCTLSVVAVAGTNWGCFSGRLAHFPLLQAGFEELDTQNATSRCLIILHLSKIPELSSSPEYNIHGQQPVPQGSWQRRLCRWLARDFEGRDRLSVLLLGSRKNSFYNTMLGLLLLKCQGEDGFSYHRRVGFCWWDPVDEIGELNNDDITNKISKIHEAPFWQNESGYFG